MEVFEISEFVEIYKNIGEGDILFKNFEEYEKSNYNITLFSCSIQYCQEPYEIFEKALKRSDHVILSRMPFMNAYKEKITVSKFYMEQILPQALGLVPAIKAGKEDLFNIKSENY